MQIDEIECKLIDGKSISGQFERAFRPMEGELAIRSKDKVHVFPLDQVCCVLFKGSPDKNESRYLQGENESKHLPGEKVEDIITKGNETYRVRLIHNETTENLLHGFYGVPSNQESGLNRIFFSRAGIINREENRKLGEIVCDKYDIHRETIDEAVVDLHKNHEYRNRQIGDILISFNLVTREQVIAALREQRLNKKKQLGEILVDKKIITDKELLMALALKFRMSTVNLDDISPDPVTLDLIPADTVRKLRIFPIASDAKKITVATFMSVNITTLDTLRFSTNRWVEMVLATHSQIDSYITKFYEDEDEDYEINIEDAISELEIEEQRQAFSLKDEAEAAPIVRLANKTILDGIKAGASDIHLLLEENGMKVSFRVNGLLQQHMKLDARVHKILIARFKIIANMDISERRLPQDGRFKAKFNNRDIEFRVSCMPGQYGENIVLRILDKTSGAVGIDQLGLDTKDVELINHIVRSTHGMLLVTGPTGSGKSTTLASVLRSLVDEPKHMISLEDPIEINVPGINQIQIHEKIGFTFSTALRNVLRHDPDVIMVGEIRDYDTAKIAVQAALTGHVLLSTLHTNNAASAFSRLSDMGVESYLVAATVKGVMAQQLLPKLCEQCRSICEPDVTMLEFIASHGIDTKGLVDHFSAGCDHCRYTGISGRVLLYEFLNVNMELQKLVTQEAPVEAIQTAACKHGMRPMVNMALEASQKGRLSIDRILPLFIE
jgi:type IV pilus assembly protein PilB